jgi:hypothetical protein
MSLNPRITDWNGCVVWLLGASTGIGRATASLLHSRGARVIVSARTSSALEGFVRAHPGSEALALDVTDRQSLATAASEVVARHGHIDLVVYSAGVFKPMRATAFDLDEALRQLLVKKYGVPYTADGARRPFPNFAGRFAPRGSFDWDFAGGMKLIYRQPALGDSTLSYTDVERAQRLPPAATAPLPERASPALENRF